MGKSGKKEEKVREIYGDLKKLDVSLKKAINKLSGKISKLSSIKKGGA